MARPDNLPSPLCRALSFLGRFGLLVSRRMPAIIVATEVRRRGFTAKITVNALVIDVELSLYVFGVFICGVGHFSSYWVEASGKLG